MPFEFIDKVGVELEGGWDKARSDLVKEGSLYAEHFSKSACIGELVSEPMAEMEQVMAYLDENWPTETQVKCGYHIHFSLKNANLYSHCMSKEFFSGFIEAMKVWAKEYPCRNQFFLKRLNGSNDFCRLDFIPEQQINLTKKGNTTRYTVFNFCYSMHKTIECRLFPTFFTTKCAKSATKALLDYVENYFKLHPMVEEFEINLEDDTAVSVIEKSSTKESKDKPFNLYEVAKCTDNERENSANLVNGSLSEIIAKISAKPIGGLIYDSYEVQASPERPKKVRRMNDDGYEEPSLTISNDGSRY